MAAYGLAEHLIPTNWRCHRRDGSAFDKVTPRSLRSCHRVVAGDVFGVAQPADRNLWPRRKEHDPRCLRIGPRAQTAVGVGSPSYVTLQLSCSTSQVSGRWGPLPRPLTWLVEQLSCRVT